MTAQPVEQPVEQPDETWAAYEVALALLVAAAVAETGRVFDRLVPEGRLVEDLSPDARSVLVAVVARSWATWRGRSAVLAAMTAAGWVSERRGAPVEPVRPPPFSQARERLSTAAATVLDRAADLAVGTEAEPEDLPDFAAEDAAEAEAIAAEIRAADEAFAAEAEAEERAALEQVAAEERARDAADARQAEEDAEADRAAAAAQAVRDAVEARRVAREERRAAQRRRVESIARVETATAAANALAASLAPAPEAVGWVRVLDPDPCDRCIAWWWSGNPGGASPARPWSIRMKRHNGCQCVQRPVTKEEANVRTIVNEPEPVHRIAAGRRTTARGRRPAPDPA